MAAAVQADAQVTSRVHGVQAEHDEEMFDTYDPDGNSTGVAPRAVCHAMGIWHGAVYCLVLDAQNRLLIQKRSSQKKVMPDRWDLSAAEHLSAGEGYQQAVVRGLEEEIGVVLPDDVHILPPPSEGTSWMPSTSDGPQGLALRGPLTPRHQRKLELPDIGILDYEFVETWVLQGYQGPVAFNENEVSAVEWVAVDILAQRMQTTPHEFTPWFLDEAELLGLIKPAAEPRL